MIFGDGVAQHTHSPGAFAEDESAGRLDRWVYDDMFQLNIVPRNPRHSHLGFLAEAMFLVCVPRTFQVARYSVHLVRWISLRYIVDLIVCEHVTDTLQVRRESWTGKLVVL